MYEFMAVGYTSQSIIKLCTQFLVLAASYNAFLSDKPVPLYPLFSLALSEHVLMGLTVLVPWNVLTSGEFYTGLKRLV